MKKTDLTSSPMTYKFYIYLDKESGSTIAIKSKQTPKPRKRMHVVYEWCVNDREWAMATFPEIPNNLLFSKRFLLIDKIPTSSPD